MRSRWLLVAAGAVVATVGVAHMLGDSITPSVQPPAPAASLPPPIPPQYMPPPFQERRIVFPVMGEAPRSETAAFCDDGNWDKIDLLVSRSDNGAFWVHEDAWNRELTGSKVGLASWISQCHANGAPIEILAADTGTLLATYDTRTGLRSQP